LVCGVCGVNEAPQTPLACGVGARGVTEIRPDNSSGTPAFTSIFPLLRNTFFNKDSFPMGIDFKKKM
jgi:hypothetical protein